jgi:hypothetical protein
MFRLRPVLAILLATTSCSSGMSIGDYGGAVQELGRGYEQETTELQRSLEAELQREIDVLSRGVDENDSEAVARFAEQAVSITAIRTRSFFAAVADALHRYRSQLDTLEPPGEVAAAHDELVAAMDAVLGGVPGLLRALEEADDFDAIDLAVHASGFTDAGLRFTAACEALEGDLAGRGVPANLRCPS